mmetsp:Transcript_21403/g.41970  ORF Transcript_21403/g.41970 Transcript_21403/m.41970 type:complete len:974 (+) Transcript_21403:629-3550(+)
MYSGNAATGGVGFPRHTSGFNSGVSVASSSVYSRPATVVTNSTRPTASFKYNSKSSLGSGALDSDWIHNTLNWAEARKNQVTKHTSKHTASKPAKLEISSPNSDAYSALNSAQTTATSSRAMRTLRSADSSSSSTSDDFSTDATSTFKDGMSTFRSGTSTAFSGGSPVSAFGSGKTPDRFRKSTSPRRKMAPMPVVPTVTSSGLSVASYSSRATRSSNATARRSVRSRKRQQNAEYSKQREELDKLMNQVLKLQDEGRFNEVPPFMKRVAVLQKRIENGWQEDHEATTGLRPSLGPLPDFEENEEKGAEFDVASTAANTPAAKTSAVSAPTSGVVLASAVPILPEVDSPSAVDPAPTNTGVVTSAAPAPKLKPGSESTGAMVVSGATEVSASSDRAPAAAPTAATAANSAARKQRKPGHKPATPSLGDRIGGIISTQLKLEVEEEEDDDSGDAWGSSGDQDDNEDAKNSTSSSNQVKTASIPTSNSVPAPVPTTARPPSPRRRQKIPMGVNLTRHVSDHLLLLSGDEEEEIISTLKQQQASKRKFGARGASSREQALSPSSSVSSKPVFSSMRSSTQLSAVAKQQSQKQKAKDRSMLSMQGPMYKSPPEYKRFSRWRNRYFILAGPILSYIKQGQTSRMITLKGARAELVVLRSTRISNKGKFEIRLQCENSKRVYRLRLRSKAKALEWYVAILNNIRVADDQQDATSLERKRREKAAARRSSGWQHDMEPSRVGEDIASSPEEGEDVNAHYKALGVEPSASSGMIKKRYRELAREYHPDKNRVGTDVSRFTVIANAFEVLSQPQTRKTYDLCERIKLLFREGIVFTIHETDEVPYQVVMFVDSEFKNLYWQEPTFGSVLQEGYRYVELRFVELVLAGSHNKYKILEFVDDFLYKVDPFIIPPGKDDFCLSLCGTRLGCTLGRKDHKMPYCINLQCNSKQMRDDVLEGLRTLRMRFSERFKQQMDGIVEAGLR